MEASEKYNHGLRALMEEIESSRRQLVYSRILLGLLLVIAAATIAYGPGFGLNEWLVVGSGASVLTAYAFRPPGPRMLAPLDRLLSGMPPEAAVHVAFTALPFARSSSMALLYLRGVLREERAAALRVPETHMSLLYRALFACGQEAWPDLVRIAAVRKDGVARPYLMRVHRRADDPDLRAAAEATLTQVTE